jgi:hypothetical protein
MFSNAKFKFKVKALYPYTYYSLLYTYLLYVGNRYIAYGMVNDNDYSLRIILRRHRRFCDVLLWYKLQQNRQRPFELSPENRTNIQGRNTTRWILKDNRFSWKGQFLFKCVQWHSSIAESRWQFNNEVNFLNKKRILKRPEATSESERPSKIKTRTIFTKNYASHFRPSSLYRF